MSLKEEQREAAAVEMERTGRADIAQQIRAGEASYYAGTAVNAALSVCDEYEAVEVQECVHDASYWKLGYWDTGRPRFTVYRKKQKPEPTLEELARRAVKAYRSTNLSTAAVIGALAEELDM